MNTTTERVYDIAIKTPLERATKLSTSSGHEVYLKREDLQPVHSFKLRGAYNKISQLTHQERANGIIAASAGNHAQGVALAAKKLGIDALVIMPRTTPSIKVDAVKDYGATVEQFGDSYSEAADYCKKRVEETNRTFIHPFDDPLVIAGQGTIGKEIIEQHPETTHIFVPVGGGGLIAGIADYIKKTRPDIKVISVEPQESSTLQTSIRHDKRVILPHVGIFADGVAVKQIGDIPYQIAREHVDDFITVTTDQICAAIKSIFEDTRSVVEPAGALAVAGVTQYGLPINAHAVAICSGANMTFERLGQVAERTLLGSNKEVIFGVTLPETPGTLRAFCRDVVNGHTISEFGYRKNNKADAHILIGLAINESSEKQSLLMKMDLHNYAHTDLSRDDVAKEHTRHMIGGRAQHTTNEYLYEITIPERPRALADFLDAVGTDWNISLFHYKSAASDYGKVLIGFESPDKKILQARLTAANFEYTNINSNTSLRFFIH